jgi:transposase
MDGRSILKANEFLWNDNRLLRQENGGLAEELATCRRERDQARGESQQMQKRIEQLEKQNERLKKRVADLSKMPKPIPSFVKPNVPAKKSKKPGRPVGHEAALRPMPEKIDVHQEVALPTDSLGQISCPACKTQLSDVKQHERLVEEIIPAKVLTTCYHTTSGYCPSCRKRVESRADEQPPAADLPHAQLGLNALTTAAVMRVCYRLPLGQITSLYQQLPGLKISPGGITKQLQRLGGWLEGQYERLKLSLRLAGVVHADETGWRTNGRNGYLWTLSNKDCTLYHIDRSRGGKVIKDLLGEGFGADGKGTLVSDFYSVYDQFDCSQQKCLAHLLNELKETTKRRPELLGHAFFKKCGRLIKAMLKLKERKQEFTEEAYIHQVKLLEKRLAKLGEGSWGDEDADRLTARLHKYRDKLTTFLHKEEVEGTNNLAERALRPAVVARKISGGSRSEKGAKAWAILASVMRTAQQQGRDVVQTIQTLLKGKWAGKEPVLLSELLIPLIQADTS